MELILISKTKLKIMLSESDMRQYKISDEADCAESGTRRAIRNLLEKAREQVGFNAEGAEIFVQLYTSKKGGCELFVTKTAPNESTEQNKDEGKGSAKANEKRSKKQHALSDKLSGADRSDKEPFSIETKSASAPSDRQLAFSFPDARSICKVCQILKDSGTIPKSKAFSGGGSFFLLLFDTGYSAYARLDKLSFILEYGQRENPDALATYISEYGKELCPQNAIETLGSI